MMDWLAPRGSQSLLDVAGGTGDISFRFLKRARNANATVLDLTEPMLAEGRKEPKRLACLGSSSGLLGMLWPSFRRRHFDVYTISFGIRNVTDPKLALSEAYRVLKPGGRIMVLEFSHIPNDLLQWGYDKYSFNVIPRLGQIIAGDRSSYQYLVESIRKFPNQEDFMKLVNGAGFEKTKYRNLTMGVACLHSGWKI